MWAYISRLFASSQHSAIMSTTKDLVEKTIEENTVAIFSKTYCPYCRKAKNLLTSYPGLDTSEVKIYELDEMEEGPEIQAYLSQKTGQRTVPSIFIKKKHIGGSDDLNRLDKSGELKKLFAE